MPVRPKCVTALKPRLYHLVSQVELFLFFLGFFLLRFDGGAFFFFKVRFAIAALEGPPFDDFS